MLKRITEYSSQVLRKIPKPLKIVGEPLLQLGGSIVLLAGIVQGFNSLAEIKPQPPNTLPEQQELVSQKPLEVSSCGFKINRYNIANPR